MADKIAKSSDFSECSRLHSSFGGLHDLVNWPPLPVFMGKTIGELHLRTKYHIEVIAVREMFPERLTMVPRADFVIKDRDILVVIGKEEDIQKIK